jgi:dUTP pyrophosphatase
MMNVKIKKLHPDAVIPSYSKEGDAGMDLTAINNGDPNDYGVTTYGTGISVEIPKGYVGLVFSRSSIYKSTGRISNSVGVIDSGYRGELMVNLDPSVPAYVTYKEGATNFKAASYKKGDRIAQLVILPYPQIQFEEVEELTTTERGDGRYGSTGK